VKAAACSLCLFVLSSQLCFAQQAPPATSATQSAVAPIDKPRIYVTESDSWQMAGSSGGSHGTFGGGIAGGASPQTAEVIKTFGQRCPQVVANNRADLTDYVVRLEHEGGKGLLRKKDKVAVFVQKTGDSIFSASTLSVGGSVQDACTAIMSHWTEHGQELKAMAVPPPPGQTQIVVASAPSADKTSLNITSTPPGADIEINGNFSGNTPSIIQVDPGKNDVKVSKKGYASWTRTLSVKGGTITLNADLEQQP
jgi:hypothetical protein